MKKFIKIISSRLTVLLMCIVMVLFIIINLFLTTKNCVEAKIIKYNEKKVSSKYDEVKEVFYEYSSQKTDLQKKLDEAKDYSKKIELDQKIQSLNIEIESLKKEMTSKKEEKNEAVKNFNNAEQEANKRVQENKKKKIYSAVENYANEYKIKRNINISQITYIDTMNISGTTYYVYEFLYEMDDGYSFTGDSRVIVNSDNFQVAVLYSNGEIVSTDEMLNPYENISVSEISKNQLKYWRKRVSLAGRITYIKETGSGGDLVITDNNGERISVHYSGNLDDIVNNDYISVKGTVSDYTAEYYNAFNAKIVLPVVTSESNYIHKIR